MKNGEAIIQKLKEEYGKPSTPLIYSKPLELLIAVILSARCTDDAVNKITPKLFEKYKNAKSIAHSNVEDIESIIRPTGFYKNKAKNIRKCCTQLIELYEDSIPNTIADLTKLAGVGRKTANVVLNELYSTNEGIAVDTHVIRISNRLGLSNSKNPIVIEKNLIKIFDEKDFRLVTLYMIFHGRKICTARKAYCDRCCIFKFCNSFRKIKEYSNEFPAHTDF